MVMGMENKTDRKGNKTQTRFVVTREFCGTQTMQEAFEQLIEKKTEEHISRGMAHFPKNGQAVFEKSC